jgi:hypothetical protein
MQDSRNRFTGNIGNPRAYDQIVIFEETPPAKTFSGEMLFECNGINGIRLIIVVSW